MLTKLTRIILISLVYCLMATSCEDDPYEANSGTFTDKRDNHEYPWVKIGTQIWMAENLAYVPYACAPDSQCGIWVQGYYGSGSFYANYTTYGCLYDWETALEACPEGWHLPSDEEWMELELFLGMPQDELDRTGILRGGDANVGGKLKEAGLIHWEEPNEGATNETGFSALPGGHRSPNGRYYSLNTSARFWTSASSDNSNAVNRFVTTSANIFDRSYKEKSRGYSIRCIKNQ